MSIEVLLISQAIKESCFSDELKVEVKEKERKKEYIIKLGALRCRPNVFPNRTQTSSQFSSLLQ